MDRATLLRALIEGESDVAAFFESLDSEEWVLRVGSAWTPAQHLDHINIAVSAVSRGFSMSRLLLRLRFGRSRNGSRTFEAVRDDYLARLGAGAVARGGFVPADDEPTVDQQLIRQRLLIERWHRVNNRLRAALAKWSDRDLDRLQLRHPLLGRITAREMLFFTVHHNQHHVRGAKSRLPRFATSGAKTT